MFLVLAATSIHAATDADVTVIKVQKVVIEESVITIVAEATTWVTLIHGESNPAYKGATWLGRPVARVQIKSDKATFIVKRPRESGEGGLEDWWQKSLKSAKDLQDGKEVGRIGYYAPDMVIKGNLIDSITGFGFLFEKGQ